MENLIKTKKLETRFFLTSAAQQNQGKPQTAAQFTKVKAVTTGNSKEFMNSTAPLNFHNITMMAGAAQGGSSTPLNGGILSPGGMMNRGQNPPQSAVGGSRGNSNNSGFNQTQNIMKLSDHIQHNSGTNSSSNVIGESGPAMIGGGGFAFYQTRLTTANPGMKSNAGAGGAGSYFMHNKPGSQMGGMVGSPQSPQSRQGKRYHHQQQHASQQSRQLTQQQQAILLSQGGFNNTTGALPSSSALNNSGPSQGGSNLRAKWTRAISGGGGGSEIPSTSPTSNSYRNNKTNNLVINTSGTTNPGLLGTLASSTSPNSIVSGQAGYSNNLYKKGGVTTAPISPTGTMNSFSPNSGLVGVITPQGNESMPVTIRVKKHKSSKPFINQPGMTSPNQQSSAGSSRLGDKTALSNKTDDCGPTTTAMDMTTQGQRKKQFNQTQPVINSFSEMPHQSPQEYMQFLEKQQRDMFQKGSGPATQGPINGSQPISPVNMNQTQMIINNFFFQPSPKEQSPASNAFGTSGPASGTFDQAANGNRNIKTALVQKRQSGTNVQPSSGNAIKPAIEVMRNMLTRPDEAPPGNPTSGIPEQVPQAPDQQVPQQEEIIIFSTKTSLDDYIIGKQIGQGAYAIVYIGMHKKSNKKVALKIYLKEKMKEIQRKKSVRREIKLMERLNHPHIAKLYEAIETDDQVVLVMEYVAGGSTHGFLKSKPNRRMDEDDARRIYRQVISALQYCHSKCVCHRDIKLENVMLDAKGNVKIIDFGFSTCIPNDKKIKIFCGTPSYMAPEIVAKKEFCGPPADIWASGVLLFAFFCGCFPFRGQNDKDLYKKIMKCELVIPDHVPSGPRSILAKILQLEPELRPSASELYCDSWVQGINYQNQNAIVSPMNYQLSQHHMMNQTQQHFGARAAITSGNNTVDMRATTANDPGARNKERVRSSQVSGAASGGTQTGFRISSSQVPPNQYHQLQQRGIIAQSPNANLHPSRQQQHQYNQDAFKAYYNTPQGQAEARMSPQGRVNTAPQNQINIITSNTGNVMMNPTATHHTNGSTTSSNRMLFNFHPGLNPSQEGEMAVKKQTSEKEVVFIAGNGSTSPQHQNAIHPSFVPSLLSSFANTPNNGSQNQNANWHSAAVIANQEDSASGKSGVGSTGPNRVGLPYSNQKQ